MSKSLHYIKVELKDCWMHVCLCVCPTLWQCTLNCKSAFQRATTDGMCSYGALCMKSRLGSGLRLLKKRQNFIRLFGLVYFSFILCFKSLFGLMLFLSSSSSLFSSSVFFCFSLSISKYSVKSISVLVYLQPCQEQTREVVDTLKPHC